jgi:hypothetical protein
MTTIKERLRQNILFEAIKIYIRRHYHWDKYSMILKKLHILKRIGNESKYARVFQGYFNYFKESQNSLFSIKIIQMSPIDMEIMLNEENMNHDYIFNSKSIWKEIYVLRICYKLLKLKKSIHLPIHYFCLYSNNHEFLKPYTQENPHLFLCNELAYDDLKNWSKSERNIYEWISCFLQIYFGLYTLQYYTGIIHNDLHWANILVFSIPKGGYWCYQIQNKKYYIENLGFLFVLWDFGMSTYEPELLYCKDHIKSCQDFLKILNTPKWVQKYYPNTVLPAEMVQLCQTIRSNTYMSMNVLLEDIIYKLSYQKTNNEDKILEEYIID